MRPTFYSATTRMIAVCIIVAVSAHVVTVPVRASEPVAAAAQVAQGRATVENVRVAFNGGVATVTYDLVAPETQGTFEVRLEVSTNGGQTYDVQPRSMSGDIGRVVAAGPSRRIVWEAGKDVESLQTDQFRFRIVIEVVARSESPASPPPTESSQTRPGAQPPPVTPPTVPPQTRQPSGGNRLLWPGLAVFGAGGALAALAGGGSLRKKEVFPTFYELRPNKPAMYGGIGVAATGLVMVLLGRRGASNTASVVLIPRGVMLYRATTF